MQKLGHTHAQNKGTGQPREDYAIKTNYNPVMFLLEPIMKICVHVKCYTASLAHYHLFSSYKQCGSLKTSGYLPVGLKFSLWTPFRCLIMSSALRDPAAPCEYMNHMKL